MLHVAEIGSMHKGNPALAYELIRQAAQAGATIAKFQFGWTREAQEKQAHSYLELRYVDPFAEQLAEWCDLWGVELMASLWSMEGLETARKVGMKQYKIAHQIANDPAYKDLIKEILSDGKTTYISNGIGYDQDHVRILYATNKYPTYPNELELPLVFGGIFGYSDHTPGIEACLLAVARGAQYVEKHFCLDKSDLCVKDTAFSATPDEFAELVRIGKGLERVRDA